MVGRPIKGAALRVWNVPGQVIRLAVLFALLKFFAPLGVMLGVSSAIVALTIRGAAGAFAAPQEA